MIQIQIHEKRLENKSRIQSKYKEIKRDSKILVEYEKTKKTWKSYNTLKTNRQE